MLPDGEGFVVQVEREASGYRVKSPVPSFEAHVGAAGEGSWSVLVNGVSYEAQVVHENGEIHVALAGERFRFGVGGEREDARGGARASGRAEVKAPMPGKVVKILASAGDSVTSGQGVLLFEAMKMQNEIRSPQDGVLAEISVEEGQPIEARERLFVVLTK